MPSIFRLCHYFFTMTGQICPRKHLRGCIKWTIWQTIYKTHVLYSFFYLSSLNDMILTQDKTWCSVAGLPGGHYVPLKPPSAQCPRSLLSYHLNCWRKCFLEHHVCKMRSQKLFRCGPWAHLWMKKWDQWWQSHYKLVSRHGLEPVKLHT